MKFENVIFFFAYLLFVDCSPLTVSADTRKFGLEFRYATSIVDVPVENLTETHTRFIPAKSNVCHLSPRVQHRICSDAVKTAYCQRAGFVFLESRAVQSEKNYSITYGGCYNYGVPPQVGPACMCPTIPPLYLKDGSVPGVVTVVIDGEVASALENSI